MTSQRKEDLPREVAIVDYAKEGQGIGICRKSARLIHVEGGLIGDHLKVTISKKRRNKLIGQVEEIQSPSPNRVSPKCPHVGSCGGCTWQQLDYQAQLDQKEKAIKTLFAPFLSRSTLYPILPSPKKWHYRNKMEFTFSQDKEGNRFLGLNKKGRYGRVVDLHLCSISPPWFSLLLDATRKWWKETNLHAYHFRSNTGTLRTLTLREGEEGREKMILLTVSGEEEFFLTKKALDGFTNAILTALPGENPSIFLRIHQIKKGSPSSFYEMHLWGKDHLRETLQVGGKSFSFQISPSSFFQPNPRQAEKLFTRALEMTDLQPSDRIYDLYCGGAVIGLLFAPYVQKVLGIEENPYSICDAKRNIEIHEATNTSIIQGNVSEILRQMQRPPTLAIVDPPRQGIDKEGLSQILRLSPPKLLYISCNPLTQRDNILELEKGGYRLEQLQPVDHFPHTLHVENIAYLTRLTQKARI